MISDNHSHISNIMLKVRYQEGDIIEKDCSCDSSYMLSAMIRVGKAIREKFHWVPMHEKVYLFIDGAGGHGTNEAINEYDKNLMIDFNIKLVFQVPRTPYSNVLDLGIWCGLQAAVEKTHYMRCCAVEALVRSVYETWEKGELNEVITKVFNRLKKVLVLIIEGDGGNELVETKRGKGFCNLDLTTEELDDINIDDYQTNINNRQIIYQNLDQSRRNNNQNNNDDDDFLFLEDEMFDDDDELGIEGW